MRPALPLHQKQRKRFQKNCIITPKEDTCEILNRILANQIQPYREVILNKIT